ncbi:hypothetical protein AB0C40_06935 [Streptomyces brevispora]
MTNAVICWHTEYLDLAVGELRAAGREVDAEVLAHISPPAAPRSTTTAPSPSTTSENSPRLRTRGTGRCGPWPPMSPEPGCDCNRSRRPVQRRPPQMGEAWQRCVGQPGWDDAGAAAFGTADRMTDPGQHLGDRPASNQRIPGVTRHRSARAAVFSAGSWGTAVAKILADAGTSGVHPG